MLFKKAPRLYTLEQIRSPEINQTKVGLEIPGHTLRHWVPCRSLWICSFRRRLYLTWLTFTGKVDVVKWPGDQ